MASSKNSIVIKEEQEVAIVKDEPTPSNNNAEDLLHVDIPLSNSFAVPRKFPPGCRVLHSQRLAEDSKEVLAEFATIKSLAIHLPTRDTAYKFNSKFSSSNYHKEANLAFAPQSKVWLAIPSEKRYIEATILSTLPTHHVKSDETQQEPKSSPSVIYSVISSENNLLLHGVQDKFIGYRGKDSTPANFFDFLKHNEQGKKSSKDDVSCNSSANKLESPPRKLTTSPETVITPPVAKDKTVRNSNVNSSANNLESPPRKLTTSAETAITPSIAQDKSIRSSSAPRRVSNIVATLEDVDTSARLEETHFQQESSTKGRHEKVDDNTAIPENVVERGESFSHNDNDGTMCEEVEEDFSAYQRVEDRQQMNTDTILSPKETSNQEDKEQTLQRSNCNEMESYVDKVQQKRKSVECAEESGINSTTDSDRIPRKKYCSRSEMEGPVQNLEPEEEPQDTSVHERFGDRRAGGNVTNQSTLVCNKKDNCRSDLLREALLVPEWADLQRIRAHVLRERENIKRRHGASSILLSNRLMGRTTVGELKIVVEARNLADINSLLQVIQRIVSESVERNDRTLMMYDLAFYNHATFGVVEREFAYNFVPPHFTEKKWIGFIGISSHLIKEVKSLFLDHGQHRLRDIKTQFRSVILILESNIRSHILICSRSLGEVVGAKDRVLRELDTM